MKNSRKAKILNALAPKRDKRLREGQPAAALDQIPTLNRHARRPGQLYCSDRCRKAAHRAKGKANA